jgi:hypothetical protein
MVNKRRIESFVKDNTPDLGKLEFSLDEISVKIDKRLLNKINRRNRK